jgi:hypothetical protein
MKYSIQRHCKIFNMIGFEREVVRLSKVTLSEFDEISPQSYRLFRTDFLAAEAGDAELLCYQGNIIFHMQSRHRTLLNAGSAAAAQVGISLRP